ncbi:adenylyl-sulfate kinase [Lipingzhangella sp. LS1_29]|uniref:Adenylyl-sulfate kinase n=1 Tax=Lipingzhangella rawalii TaxID=2055835 RepID=A0ABU2H3A1_9ACTN|nr:adenylyl-sulfate kinase [Lipingzhangella rawalii]MDS1269778.1 adenylyl-sulfate kinase [Lipingzhangella rawalii]
MRDTVSTAAQDSVPSHTPDTDTLAHLELLLNGCYPLPGFMTASESASVRRHGQLPDGRSWPIPVTLPVPADLADVARLRLTDPEGAPLAELEVTERWWAGGEHRLAGPVTLVDHPAHGVFRRLRLPARDGTAATAPPAPDGPLLAVVTETALHQRALAQLNHAATELADTEHGTPETPAPVLVLVDTGFHDERPVRAVRAARHYLPEGSRVQVVTLPRRDPDTGEPYPTERREALTAHVAAAHGATHLLADSAQALRSAAGTPIPVVPTRAWCYDTGVGAWRPASTVRDTHARADLAPDEVAELLARGERLPAWFTPPEVADELAAQYPPRTRRGLTLFFTGLSGSGKSTVARAVAERVRESGRAVTLLDGDVVRRMLSAGLTFSKADRDLNIRRIGYVASEINRHGGVAICAPIAPYAATRAEVRAMVEEYGDMFLVHVSTPLEVCEARDRKGLYAKARAGEISEFTGISDPYEEPTDAQLRLDTSEITVEEATDQVLSRLHAEGWLPEDNGA